jgi:putative peptidoglycan lipid II flippase
VKIVASLIAPYLTDDQELVAGYLGLANGLGFLAGATVGYFLLRANLNPPSGRLISLEVVRTILVTIAASLIAGLLGHVVDQLLGLESLTRNWGGAGSLLRLLVLGLIMVPIIGGVSAWRPGARRAGRPGCRAAPPGWRATVAVLPTARPTGCGRAAPHVR